MAADPDSSTLRLLLHGDGSDGGTTITDSSLSARTITRNGGTAPTTVTAQSKFGGSSIRFAGSGAYLSTTLTPETGDFTAECWARFDSTSSAHNIIGYQNNAATVRAFVIYRDTTYLKAAVGISESWVGGSNLLSSVSAITTSTWYHIALTRSGSDFKLWLNGSQVGTTYTNAGALNTSSSTLIIGSRTDAFHLVGHMDEIGIWGACKYSGTFTPNSDAWEDPVAGKPTHALHLSRLRR